MGDEVELDDEESDELAEPDEADPASPDFLSADFSVDVLAGVVAAEELLRLSVR